MQYYSKLSKRLNRQPLLHDHLLPSCYDFIVQLTIANLDNNFKLSYNLQASSVGIFEYV